MGFYINDTELMAYLFPKKPTIIFEVLFCLCLFFRHPPTTHDIQIQNLNAYDITGIGYLFTTGTQKAETLESKRLLPEFLPDLQILF